MKVLKIIIGKDQLFEFLNRRPASLIRPHTTEWLRKLRPIDRRSYTELMKFIKFDIVKLVQHRGKHSDYVTYTFGETILGGSGDDVHFEIILGEELERCIAGVKN